MDHALCVRLNRGCLRAPVRAVFRTVSRLGDGIFWYALMLALLLTEQERAALPVLHMIAAGLTGTLLYRWLKPRVSRPRPFEVHSDVACVAAPLDRFSFPSGHTLHAFAFGIVAIAYFPALAWLLAPFMLLVAASRVVLGLHYPSDVAAGALLGTLISASSLLLV